MSDAKKTVHLEIMTPQKLLYSGEIESLIVPAFDGEEGFLPGHVWCNTLLADKGQIKFREPGSSGAYRIADIHRGFVEIKDTFLVFTEAASWHTEADAEAGK